MTSIKPPLSATGLVDMIPQEIIVEERSHNANGMRERMPEVPTSTAVQKQNNGTLMSIAKTTSISFLHRTSTSTEMKRVHKPRVATPSVLMAVNDTSVSGLVLECRPQKGVKRRTQVRRA